jgi:hypothetical protein
MPLKNWNVLSTYLIFSCIVVDEKLFWSAGPVSTWAKRKCLDLALELDPDLDPNEIKCSIRICIEATADPQNC